MKEGPASAADVLDLLDSLDTIGPIFYGKRFLLHGRRLGFGVKFLGSLDIINHSPFTRSVIEEGRSPAAKIPGSSSPIYHHPSKEVLQKNVGVLKQTF